MDGHKYDWYRHTEEDFNDEPDPLLPWAGDHDHVFGVENDGNLSKYASNGPTNSHTETNVEFDFDVTQNFAIPPLIDIIRAPYQRVDKGLKVQGCNTKYEDRGCKVSGLKMGQERRDGEDDCRRGQDWNGNGKSIPSHESEL